MNKQLLLKTLQKIKTDKIISLEEIVSKEKSTYADAYDIMSYFIEEKIITEKDDGVYSLSSSVERIESLRKENGDWLIEFTDKELKEKLDIINEDSLSIINIVNNELGLAEEEIISKMENKCKTFNKTLQSLVKAGYIVYYKEKYYCTLSSKACFTIAKLYREKLRNEQEMNTISVERVIKEMTSATPSEDNDENEETDGVDADNIFEDNILDEIGLSEDETEEENKSEAGTKNSCEGLSSILSQIVKAKEEPKHEALKHGADSTLFKGKLINEKGKGFIVEFDLFDTPKELIKKAIAQISKKSFKLLMNNKDGYEDIKSDINNLDENSSSICIELNDNKVPLVWNKKIVDQLISELEQVVEKEVLCFIVKLNNI